MTGFNCEGLVQKRSVFAATRCFAGTIELLATAAAPENWNIWLRRPKVLQILARGINMGTFGNTIKTVTH